MYISVQTHNYMHWMLFNQTIKSIRIKSNHRMSLVHSSTWRQTDQWLFHWNDRNRCSQRSFGYSVNCAVEHSWELQGKLSAMSRKDHFEKPQIQKKNQQQQPNKARFQMSCHFFSLTKLAFVYSRCTILPVSWLILSAVAFVCCLQIHSVFF